MWNQFRGVNPLMAQETELAEDIYIGKSNTALLKNKSVPTGLLSTEQPVTEEQGLAILDAWEKKHGGSSKTGKTGFIGYGTKYQRISMTPADMEFYKLKQWNRATILGKYGVPAIVAGFKDDQTPLSGNDTKEQMKFFWDITLLPHLRFLEDKLLTEFFKRFAPTMRAKFNVSEIPELQEDLYKLSERQRADIAAGILTQNEARKERGKDPVNWGDTWYKPIALQAIDAEPEKEREAKTELSIFNKQESPYTDIYKSAHWYTVTSKWSASEMQLKDQLKTWIQSQRASILEEIAGSNGVSVFKRFNAKYWAQQKTSLKKITDAVVIEASSTALEDVKVLLTDLSIDKKYLEYITEAAITNDNEIVRLYDKIFDYLKDSIKKGDIDDVREKYKIAQARLGTISHIEIGRVINKVRIRAFTAVGINDHEWLSSRNGDTSSACIDGEICRIGKEFSNKQTYPLEDVDNDELFALTLPIIKENTNA